MNDMAKLQNEELQHDALTINPFGESGLDTLEVVSSVWGDLSGPFDPDAGLWVAPDGRSDIVPDIVAAIGGFANSPGNPTKMRVDVDPCILDFKINIIDIVHLLDAFRGLPYPFGPGFRDCPLDPCG